MYIKVWGEITYPFPNFNYANVWENMNQYWTTKTQQFIKRIIPQDVAIV